MAKFIAGTLVVGLCWAAGPALAQNGEAGASGRGDLVSLLTTANVEQVVAAVQALQTESGPEPVGAVIALLRAGPPDDVTHAAIETLGALGHPHSVDILGEYASHRRPAVRVLALQSLATIDAAAVEPILVDGLRDSNPEVRATAAQALGGGGYRQAVPVLFQAFERGVGEASGAIGRLGGPEAAERLSRYLGQRDLPVLLEGLAEFLVRDAFPNAEKEMIVENLLELAGPEVRRFLVGQVAELPNTPENNSLIQAMRDAIAQIPEE